MCGRARLCREALSWLAGCVLLGCAFGYALAQSHPAAIHARTEITLEDLQSAFERGELSEAEFRDLADRVAARLALDSLEEASLRARLLEAEAIEVAAALPSASHQESMNMTLSVQTVFPVRGSGTDSRTVHGEIARGRQRVAVAAGRAGARGWRVRRLVANLASGPWRARMGSIETRWTGGLLIGPAPRFIRPHAWRTLLQPYDARLTGIECSWNKGTVTVELLASFRYDSIWSHSVRGVRLRSTVGSLHVEPACLWQVVESPRSTNAFTSGIVGVSLGRTTTGRRWHVDAAASRHGSAVQGEIITAVSSGVRWHMSAWRVSTGFRHPLLAARGESDRESIDYPELATKLATASTGERGGEGRLTVGSRSGRAEVRVTWWREWPGRGASLRTTIRYAVRPAHLMRSLNYVLLSRATEARAFRHEIFATARSARWNCRARVRRIHGHWSPFSTWSGDCRIGHDFPIDSYGDLAVSLTLESYDWSAWQHMFMVFRLDHQVSVKAGTFSLHARWRPRSDVRPASLSMRLSSVISL